MNGVNGMAGTPGLWQEARNADGRVYYYNTQTKATQWTKPVDLMSPAEKALSNQPWKEYTAEGGKKYWYNTETKQSSWEMPQVYKDALGEGQPPARPAPPTQTFVAGGNASLPLYQSQSQHHEPPMGQDRQIAYANNDVNGLRGPPVGSTHADPDYATFEEAEAAFLKLLRRAGVQPDWTWDQTMRTVIKDPQYRALKDPKDRKAAFEKYTVEVRIQEKDRAKERLAKLRSDFGTMLRSHPEIKHYTRWKTARPIIEGETIFRSTSDDNERRQLFEEYIIDLKKANMEHEAVTRKAAMDELVGILKALNLEPYTRWAEAHSIIQSDDRFRQDEKFQMLSKADMLTAFENHIKSLERAFNDARQQQKNSKVRRERQNRDRYLALLRELKAGGQIKAGSKWMNIHPLIEHDERYTAMLGQSGSTPLDLFWDMVEEEERELRGKRNEVLDVLDDKRFEILQKTTAEDFMGVMRADRRTAHIDPDALRLIFERLREKVIRRSEDDKHQAERHQRRGVDALRSKIKHLDPPVTVGDSWEQVRARVSHVEEFRVLESDDIRRTAFDKVMRRLKEREEDAERERSRRDDHRDRSEKPVPRDRDRDRDRERDRDARHGYPSSRRSGSGRHAGRHSRTPEPDAYEAERKKAQAERERQYRKASVTGLSPPPPHHRSERERTDRDRERDRDRGSARTASHYDRERHGRGTERDDDRERPYRSRADPKGSRDELDYGGGSTSRRRARGDRDSDAESGTSRRESKRSRRGEHPSPRSPVPPSGSSRPKSGRRTSVSSNTATRPSAAAGKEKNRARDEPAVHSGSEEGEIEEE